MVSAYLCPPLIWFSFDYLYQTRLNIITFTANKSLAMKKQPALSGCMFTALKLGPTFILFSLPLQYDSGIASYNNSRDTVLKNCVALSAIILTLQS